MKILRRLKYNGYNKYFRFTLNLFDLYVFQII